MFLVLVVCGIKNVFCASCIEICFSHISMHEARLVIANCAGEKEGWKQIEGMC
jgi:hypothetical protein